ncbi:aminotransferase class I/II-fold pyridoxal phosphate-dependent enzyme [Chryseobacterium camelliae]|uniref:aminotransferase class I/II-fold pyridoxal phosphate-dependent enzyme n=1 Tax=Chryseobacterium camelliae TaxID=1265445 RepID=UPI00285E37C8|nr:aminotransferase class I/II-fold pyridoxal phosphate-dependent enzyme [Chryseobacterium camelliae]MDR6515485.1 8-amino-7-oxononanoate synthase [Chryseobacterium camelliae]
MIMFDRWQKELDKRSESGTLRIVKPVSQGIDFYSNDYLGFARNIDLQNIMLDEVSRHPEWLSGTTGSRLISGNTAYINKTEQYIAQVHGFPAALLFSSGYQANLALFSALPGRQDTIITDEQIHRSAYDGCRLSFAKKMKFRHNDMDHLEQLLKKESGNCLIAVESLYSMEGDLASLAQIAALAEYFGAGLIVDEAHAFGIFGHGLIDRYGLQDKVTAAVVTYGKALGMHGAAVLSSNLVRNYLINFAAPLIYTTSSPDVQWLGIRSGYEFLSKHQPVQQALQNNIRIFRQQGIATPSAVGSPVQAVIIPDRNRLKSLQNRLAESGFLTYAVYSPSVKEGTERLRICLHSFNTEKEIIRLCEIIKESA